MGILLGFTSLSVRVKVRVTLEVSLFFGKQHG
jgi:hypothetical protein